MPITTSFEFGDVVVVPFPFTDQRQLKRRPAIVISSARYNADRPDLIILAVTSQMRPDATLGDVAIERWSEAGLLKPSVFKPILATIERSIVIRKLGRLVERDLQRVDGILESILGP